MSREAALPKLAGPFQAKVRIPGSKSLSLRALTSAGLASGRSHLYGALRAEDGEAMTRVLRGLGVSISDDSEPWTIVGRDGRLDTPDEPLDVGQSALTLRIACVLATMIEGEANIVGQGSIGRRPIGPLLEILKLQGVAVTRGADGFPIVIRGHGGLWGGDLSVDCSLTTQFATAVLLGAPTFTEPTRLRLENLGGSRGYLDATAEVMSDFGGEVTPTITGFEVANSGYQASDYLVEPDASAAVYPLVAAAITSSQVEIHGLRETSAQPDIALLDRLVEMGCRTWSGDEGLILDASQTELSPIDADMSSAPDGAMALAVACLFAKGVSRISGLGSLQHKESDRIQSLAEGLRAVGGQVEATADQLTITPGPARRAVIDPHGDHRVAMSLALVGLANGGVSVSDPDVVAKTWPGFWATMSSLGAG